MMWNACSWAFWAEALLTPGVRSSHACEHRTLVAAG